MADRAGELSLLMSKLPSLWHRINGNAGEAVWLTALERLGNLWRKHCCWRKQVLEKEHKKRLVIRLTLVGTTKLTDNTGNDHEQ